MRRSRREGRPPASGEVAPTACATRVSAIRAPPSTAARHDRADGGADAGAERDAERDRAEDDAEREPDPGANGDPYAQRLPPSSSRPLPALAVLPSAMTSSFTACQCLAWL